MGKEKLILVFPAFIHLQRELTTNKETRKLQGKKGTQKKEGNRANKFHYNNQDLFSEDIPLKKRKKLNLISLPETLAREIHRQEV